MNHLPTTKPDTVEFSVKEYTERHPTIGYHLGTAFTVTNNTTGAGATFTHWPDVQRWIQQQALQNRKQALL